MLRYADRDAPKTIGRHIKWSVTDIANATQDYEALKWGLQAQTRLALLAPVLPNWADLPPIERLFVCVGASKFSLARCRRFGWLLFRWCRIKKIKKAQNPPIMRQISGKRPILWRNPWKSHRYYKKLVRNGGPAGGEYLFLLEIALAMWKLRTFCWNFTRPLGIERFLVWIGAFFGSSVQNYDKAISLCAVCVQRRHRIRGVGPSKDASRYGIVSLGDLSASPLEKVK